MLVTQLDGAPGILRRGVRPKDTKERPGVHTTHTSAGFDSQGDRTVQRRRLTRDWLFRRVTCKTHAAGRSGNPRP